MQKLEGIIFDFDGVAYKYRPDFNAVCSSAAARAAIACGVPGVFEQLVADFTAARDPHSFTKRWQAEHGLDPLAYHHAYHDGIDVAASIDARQEATAVFAELAERKVPMIILTHGSQPWVKRVGAHIDMIRHFADEHIIALEHTNWTKKPDSPAPFLLAAARLGIAPDRLGMVEDSSGNLHHAHSLGMATGYLHYEKPLAPKPAHVHVQGSSLQSVVRQFGFL